MADPYDADKEVVFNSEIDQLLADLPVGSVQKATGLNMYGINFRQTGNMVPRDRSLYGYTFFTRPQLNLSTHNLTNFRGFYNLLTANTLSYQRFTRMSLDPRLGYSANSGLVCPFLDNSNPFLSILTNNIVSLSGWPDITVPTYTSESGVYGEETSFVDGATNHYESFDVDVTFRNTKGNPLIYLFYVWIKYESLVLEGVLNPYIDMITENEIDYNTRIYRVVLDQRKRYVTYIGSTGASFPVNVPIGNLFDYNTDSPYNTRNSEINIRFRSLGFIAFDDILKLQFNKATAIFNPEIRKILKYDLDNGTIDSVTRDDSTIVYRVPGSSYVRIPHGLSSAIDSGLNTGGFYSLNHRAIPYINLTTSELEWWTDERNFVSGARNNFETKIGFDNSGEEGD